MKESIQSYSISQFLPKINWVMQQLLPPYGDNILARNLYIYNEYKKWWQVVQDLQDVQVHLNQANSQFGKHKMLNDEYMQRQQLKYLYSLNIKQFHIDIGRVVVKSNKAHPKATPNDLRQLLTKDFYYQGMKKMFTIDRSQCPLYVVTRNKTNTIYISKLIYLLQDQNDN